MLHLNIKVTAQRKCIRNPSARILSMLKRARKDSSMSFEPNKFCFFSGFITQNTSDVFSLLNLLKTHCLPSSLKYNSTFLANDYDIAKSFNEYFSSSCSIAKSIGYPDIWKTAFIRPLQKSDSSTDITNYMPISLIPKDSLNSYMDIFNFLLIIGLLLVNMVFSQGKMLSFS